jgi:hypothetical protein
MQDVFWYIKEAIDAYFDGRPFQVTVKAGCIIGRKLEGRATEPEDMVEIELEDAAPLSSPQEDFDEEDTGLPMPPPKIAAGSVRADLGADEVEALDADVIDAASIEEQDLDAFIEGKKRPSHLDVDLDDDDE